MCDLFVEEADAQERQVEVVRSVGSFLEPGLRSDLLAALWAFVREWISCGRPKSGRRLKGFEHWCEILGGIAGMAKVGDPFEPRPADLAGGETDAADMAALIEKLATGVQTKAEYRFEAVVQAALEVNAFEWCMKGREKKNDDGTSQFVIDHSERRKFSNLLADTYGGRTFQLRDGRRATWSHRGKNRGRHYTLTIAPASP